MTALTINSNWSPSYITTILNYPMLSEEDEQQYSRAYKLNNCLKSAEKLVMSHMKLVYSISRQYLGYNLPQDDLIQEGTIGLMKATQRYDPDNGVRLASYAIHWIKAEITEYIIKNFRMVKIATTKPQRKLFFNLRSLRAKYDAENGSLSESLTPTQIESIALTLDVDKSDVREMETRLSGNESCIDLYTESDAEYYIAAPEFVDYSSDPSNIIESRKLAEFGTTVVQEALGTLSEREQRIIYSRYVDVQENGLGLTLHDLSLEYGVSKERIRQIEVSGMNKLKKYLSEYKTSIV